MGNLSTLERVETPLGMGATTLNDDLQFLRDLESQYQVAATNPFANPPSSSIHEALDVVDNFLSYTLDEVIGAFDSAWPKQALALLSKLELHIPLPGLSMDHMLSMHTASDTIKSCLGAIKQATKLKDTMLHKENARATTSTSLQGKVSQGKAMSSQEERENKAKLVKLRATFDEIKKILHL
ncbi:unnamed protein product [Linum trigynum]|uniref:Uncharacterized protein n=1 Tax=Linum trigynum TaxID=586398 RepID=A0AAV2EPB9_9ROSI